MSATAAPPTPSASRVSPSLARWRLVWELALAPELDTDALVALREALASDSDCLVQQATTEPPPLSATDGAGYVMLDPAVAPVEAADAIAFALWRGGNLNCVEEVVLAFGELCGAARHRLEAAGCPLRLNEFFSFWDTEAREVVVGSLLDAVTDTLSRRDVLLPLGPPPPLRWASARARLAAVRPRLREQCRAD